MRLLAVIVASLIFAVSSAKAENLEDCAKGAASLEAGNRDAAIDELTRCMELGGLSDRNLAAASNNRAFIYLIKGDYDQAIRDFDAAIRLNPLFTQAHYGRGNAYRRKKAYDQAIQDFDVVIRLNSASARAYRSRCWTYGLMRRPDQALPDCNESLRINPRNPNTLDSRAFAYWLLEEHEKARQDLDQAREIDSSHLTWQERFHEFEEIILGRLPGE